MHFDAFLRLSQRCSNFGSLGGVRRSFLMGELMGVRALPALYGSYAHGYIVNTPKRHTLEETEFVMYTLPK